MNEKEQICNEELIKRVESAAREGAKQGVKEGGKSNITFGMQGKVISMLIKVVILLVALFIVSSVMFKMNPLNAIKGLFSQESDVENHDMTFENNGILGYTVADFEEVILGDSSKLKKLEVYVQEMSQMVQLTETGLAKLKIFTKSKYYTYHGTAIYTVDLGKLGKDSIRLDEGKLTVILTIPHTEMTTLNIPQDKMEIGDTQKGLLAFGDLSMTDEQSKELMEKARNHMTEKLKEDKVQEQADQIARLTVWELYQPLITKMAPGYSLSIEVQETTTD